MIHLARRPTALVFAATAAAGVTMLTGCIAAPGSHPAKRAAAAPASTGRPPAAAPRVWGIAHEVPGTVALNTSMDAGISSVSCASAGNCSAAGQYSDGPYLRQAFVVSEVNGNWRRAQEVPGTAALNKGGNDAVSSLSCASAGNCSAGGYYTDGSGHRQAFVVSEVNGSWRRAQEVPGTAALNKGGNAETVSVSCASAGNCSADGGYLGVANMNSSGNETFVVSEVNGSWQRAEELPGSAALSKRGGVGLISMSCASAGNCGAGGEYEDVSGEEQALVVSEVNGSWQRAQEVPGTAALDKGSGGNAWIYSVSCASAGNCSAAGQYDHGPQDRQVFVVSQTDGAWQQAEEVPGTATLNKGRDAEINSVSCASAGNCGAGGDYLDGSEDHQAFVVNQTDGAWQQAEEVPGTATLNKGPNAFATITSVSCPSAGNCTAGGSYTEEPERGRPAVFVVSETNGIWGQAEVLDTTNLNKTFSVQVGPLSCPSVGNCTAGGYYTEKPPPANPQTFPWPPVPSQAFVVSET